MKHDTKSMCIRVYLYIDYYKYLSAWEENFSELIRYWSTLPEL